MPNHVTVRGVTNYVRLTKDDEFDVGFPPLNHQMADTLPARELQIPYHRAPSRRHQNIDKFKPGLGSRRKSQIFQQQAEINSLRAFRARRAESIKIRKVSSFYSPGWPSLRHSRKRATCVPRPPSFPIGDLLWIFAINDPSECPQVLWPPLRKEQRNMSDDALQNLEGRYRLKVQRHGGRLNLVTGSFYILPRRLSEAMRSL